MRGSGLMGETFFCPGISCFRQKNRVKPLGFYRQKFLPDDAVWRAGPQFLQIYA